jgi:uncharacterized protein YuzE
MKDFKVYYDEEEEVVELSPDVHLEFDKEGNLIGVELFNASKMFKDVIKRMEKKLEVA